MNEEDEEKRQKAIESLIKYFNNHKGIFYDALYQNDLLYKIIDEHYDVILSYNTIY